MDAFTRIPVTVAVFAACGLLLSGCIAYDAASTVVSAGSTVVGVGASAVEACTTRPRPAGGNSTDTPLARADRCRGSPGEGYMIDERWLR